MRVYTESQQWYGVQPKIYGVYGWMAAALAVTATIAYLVSQSPTMITAIYTNSWLLIGLIIGQLALVLALTMMIYRLSPAVALAGLMLYAALNGLTLSAIFIVYNFASIVGAFITTSCMFAAMAIYGYFTETDLTRMGNLLLMGLFGVIIAMLVNLFLKSTQLDFFISCAAVVIFTLLIAYDTQKIKAMLAQVPETYRIQVSVIGALMLYLDFINLLLNLLRLMGARRQD